MDVQRYQVVGACAPATTRSPQGGHQRQLFFKGQVLPEDTPAVEIQHLLSVKLIAPIEVGPAVEVAPEPTQGEGATDDTGAQPDGGGADSEGSTEEGAGHGAGDSGGVAPPAQPAAEAGQKWAEAEAKAEALDTAGSKPDGRSNPLVMAAFLVRKGYDRAAVEKADKKDLLDLVNGLDG